MPKKWIFLHSCTPGMTLDYKHREIGLHNLLGKSIVLTLQKNYFLSYFGLSYPFLCYPPLCAIPCSNFLETIFFEPQNMSVIGNQNQKKVSFSRMGTHFSPLATLSMDQTMNLFNHNSFLISVVFSQRIIGKLYIGHERNDFQYDFHSIWIPLNYFDFFCLC